MKKTSFIITAIVAMIGTFFACNENIIDETTGSKPENEETGFKEIQVAYKIATDDLPQGTQLSKLKIVSLCGEENVENDGTGRAMSYEGNLPQLLMLTDSNDELLLMARADFNSEETQELSARSTAIAMVTMHPALSGTISEVYPQLVQLITECPSFNELEELIAETTRNGRPLFDSGNTALVTALNKVFEQAVATGDEEENDGELPYEEGIETPEYAHTYTRAPQLKGYSTIAGINVGPFYVKTDGAKVIFTNYSLTPLYSGTIKHHNTEENFDIPSGDDRGISFFFKNDIGSNDATYTFTREGEYQFYFDKTTAESYIDQGRHVVCNILEVLGLPLDQKWIMKTASDMVTFMTARGMDIAGLFTNPNTDAWDIAETVSLGILDYIKEGHLEKMLVQAGARQVAAQFVQTALKKFMAGYTIYQACSGTINAVMRVTMRLESPDNVSFGLYYYNGKITTATKASLAKYSGDNQDGLIGRRLNEPIRVKVTTIGSDGSEVLASNFHKVVFETEEHNGIAHADTVSTDPFGYAQTYWTLDQENKETQYMKAKVIDIVTKETISETVTFSGTPTQTANITFRLDWSPTDPNCDIDLHVYDPEGHHIYFSNMYCACGGYLDRDDLHGPGPEHIYFTEAKPGKYRVYVHHYYSDTQGTVGFTVTTGYNNDEYVNKSSVSYLKVAYIGTLEVTGTPYAPASRAAAQETNTRFYYEENVPEIPTYMLPKKNK
ncbi:MAG: hypothetical protein IKY71_03535 [Bacteroidaceae bacterium]|nr:hypothetical protein [Bacteroidaceae bacterium]